MKKRKTKKDNTALWIGAVAALLALHYVATRDDTHWIPLPPGDFVNYEN